MAHRPLVSFILFGASLAAFGTALAQTPADTSNGPAASPAGTPAPAGQASDSASAPAQSPAPSGTPNTPPTAPAATPSAPGTSPTPAAPTGPSADTLKKARLAGYHPETRNGTTMFCQVTADLGTRFPTKKCLDEQQLKSVVDIQHENQDSLRKPGMCTGAGCAGH